MTTLNRARAGLLLTLHKPVRSKILPSVLSVSLSSTLSLMPDFIQLNVTSSSKSLAHAGSPISLVGVICSKLNLVTLDLFTLRALLMSQIAVQVKTSTMVSGSPCLDFSPPTSNHLLSGSLLFIKNVLYVKLLVPILNLQHANAAALLQNSTHISAPFSLMGASCANSLLVVLNHLISGMLLLVQRPIRLGFSAATCDSANLEASPILRFIAHSNSPVFMANLTHPEVPIPFRRFVYSRPLSPAAHAVGIDPLLPALDHSNFDIFLSLKQHAISSLLSSTINKIYMNPFLVPQDSICLALLLALAGASLLSLFLFMCDLVNLDSMMSARAMVYSGIQSPTLNYLQLNIPMMLHGHACLVPSLLVLGPARLKIILSSHDAQ